jgi:hypothetical protein
VQLPVNTKFGILLLSAPLAPDPVNFFHACVLIKRSFAMANKLNVQFNCRQNETLEAMADELGTTKAGVLKTALALLEVALREKKDGNSLGVIKGEKVVKEIIGIE